MSRNSTHRQRVHLAHVCPTCGENLASMIDLSRPLKINPLGWIFALCHRCGNRYIVEREPVKV